MTKGQAKPKARPAMRLGTDTGPASAILSTVLRELPWSSHLHILSRTKRPEEREFYLRMAAQQRWQVLEVARQIDTGLFERAVLNPPKISAALRDMQPQADLKVRRIAAIDRSAGKLRACR
jgi:predicted nuclease of restriction endonuclease-like (RecB) superfamily